MQPFGSIQGNSLANGSWEDDGNDFFSDTPVKATPEQPNSAHGEAEESTSRDSRTDGTTEDLHHPSTATNSAQAVSHGAGLAWGNYAYTAGPNASPFTAMSSQAPLEQPQAHEVGS